MADTRRAGGPEPRLYETPFARVWDEILAYVDAHGRWALLHKDEELGLITVACTTPVFRFVDDVTIWVALDDNGLTRVDALSRSRRGRGDLGANARRIVRMLRSLDAALGPSARLATTRRPDRPDASSPSGGRSTVA
ncbi:MAG: DUF1499 domain-containing protein [Gemmatimonadetes bacterium]|nr:DUF1499 domain-containing protein [Gemmatimonadota bacterium]